MNLWIYLLYCMDTQGMSLGKGGVIDPDRVYPPYIPKKMTIFNELERKELKDIIHEALDERSTTPT